MSIELKDQQSIIKNTEVNGRVTVGDIIERISRDYNFDGHQPENLHPLNRGLETAKYTFWVGDQLRLLKIYSRDASRNPRFRLRNVSGLERKLAEAGVPVSRTIRARNGHGFIVVEKRVTPNKTYTSAASISEIFPGTALQKPTTTDVEAMAGYMAIIHQLDAGVVLALDSWSLLRLVETYDGMSKIDSSLQQTREIIAPVVKQVRDLNLNNRDQFPHALVHGDLHPFNILKNDSGLCLLDLGCMDIQQRIADIAIFLSMTCADFSDPGKTRQLFQSFMTAYEQCIKLTSHEKEALPLLIRANYAMFALRTAELLQQDPIDTEVRHFHEYGLKGLQFMDSLVAHKS